MDVAGTIQTTGFKMTTGAGTDKVLKSDASGVASWQTAAGGSLWTQTVNDIYYNTGNVGIGTTTSPGAKLEVAGDIKLSGASPTYKITNLVTPTADTDAATKAYVDAAGGTDPCEGRYVIIKFTLARYDGNLGGKSGADTKCASEFSGYHMCDGSEIYNAVGCLPDPTRSIRGYAFSGRVHNLRHGYESPTVIYQNCEEWTSNAAIYAGTIELKQDGTNHWYRWWEAGSLSCASVANIACCSSL